jgi:DnaK suppressor protein
VDDQTARQRLHDERHRVQELLNQSAANGWDERLGANEQGDMSDSAEPLIADQEDSAVAAGLRERLDAIKRAELRLSDGTYGRSVRSDDPIPDDRLEADPAAELTVDEAQEV